MTDYVKLSPSGGDDTAQINAALASLAGARGPWLDFGPGLFNVPGGITENVPGLIVTGRSTRMQGPTDLSASGTVLKVSKPGAWAWARGLPNANEYRGGKFSGITFIGNNQAAGGLLVYSCYNVFELLNAGGFTGATARGFYVLAPNISGGSAQRNLFSICGAQDCMIGAETVSNDGSTFHDFTTLKTTAAGIHGQGWGLIVRDTNTAVGIGKLEGNATGALLASSGTVLGEVQYEDNANWDVDADRNIVTQGAYTDNIIGGGQGKVRIGAWNFHDQITGIRYPRTFLDVPNPQGYAKMTVTLM